MPPAEPGVDIIKGAWTISTEGGQTVFTHQAASWKGEGFPVALFRNTPAFSNGTARIRFKLLGADDDYTAGLLFGYDGTSGYFARYNTKDGNVAIWRLDGNERAVVKHGEQHEQLARGEWHELVLTIDGRKVTAVVDGRLRVEHELEAAPSGRLGLWTKPTATSAFSGLRVTR